MASWKATFALLGATSALANPLLPPSKVRRDDPPAPSDYPLDEPCGGEWKYLNFDPKNSNDKTHLLQLHTAICTDMDGILEGALDAVSHANKNYLRYFPPKDDDDDYPSQITDVLNKLYSTSSGGIAPLIESFTIDNKGIFSPSRHLEALSF